MSSDFSRAIPCVYWGIFFDKDELRKSVGSPTLVNEIEHPHVTFGFAKPFPEELLGKRVDNVAFIGYGCDGRSEAYQVALTLDIAEYYANGTILPHVTVSVGIGCEPKDSAKLGFDSLYWKPRTVSGTFGYFGFDGKVHIIPERKEIAMSDSIQTQEEKESTILQADKKIAGKEVTLTFTLPDYYEAECLGKWDDFSEGARFFNDFLTSGNELDDLFTYASENTHNTRDEIQCLVSGAMQAVFATLD